MSSVWGRNEPNAPSTTTHYDLIFWPARYLCRCVNFFEYHRQVWRRPNGADSYKAIGRDIRVDIREILIVVPLVL